MQRGIVLGFCKILKVKEGAASIQTKGRNHFPEER